jgi:hypothetical protein
VIIINKSNVSYESLSAYELCLLEFSTGIRSKELIEQMRQKLNDKNKITLEKLEHIDIMAKQYVEQSKLEISLNKKRANKNNSIICLLKSIAGNLL